MVDDPMLTISPNFPSSDLDYDVVSSYNSSDDDDDVDVEPLNDIVSSPSPSSDSLPPPPSAAVTIAITPPPPTTTITTLALPTTTNTTASTAAVDSRRLFQRLWTDEDEIELLQGFLDYTATRGPTASGHYHDTAAFYDQIQSKLQLHFNKNQLVEKLRRLKKKYRTVLAKINSNNNSKDFVFKSPHDQATFEISAKIWTNLSPPNPIPTLTTPATAYQGGGGGSVMGGDFNDGDYIHNVNPVTVVAATPPRPANSSYVVSQINLNSAGVGVGGGGGGFDPMLTSLTGNGGGLPKLCTRKRSRISTPTKMEEKCADISNASADNTVAATNNNVGSVGVNSPLQGLVEETLRNCLSPVLKELISSVVNGAGNAGQSGLEGGGGGVEGGSGRFKGVGELGLNAMPLNFSGVGVEGGVDEKWRKQQILELEVYSKRLELVQEQIKVSLEELRSMES
ncbi:putative transcription factor At3g04930 [Silene latifolia]|uniref:putative transcription factor At3g04930 n=1 Tax=Silene latifolia TaxID=37657 RepID=UPI003D76E6FC